jgi:hypothetical protein
LKKQAEKSLEMTFKSKKRKAQRDWLGKFFNVMLLSNVLSFSGHIERIPDLKMLFLCRKWIVIAFSATDVAAATFAITATIVAATFAVATIVAATFAFATIVAATFAFATIVAATFATVAASESGFLLKPNALTREFVMELIFFPERMTTFEFFNSLISCIIC